MIPRYPERIAIAHLPTPIEPLERLSQQLGGPKLLIKRDDQTGLATGGNKTRKLEFLVADALRQGCEHLITTGAPQSNHCRQTAAAAARSGLDCSLVLRGEPPVEMNGNLLLDTLLGANLIWAGDRPEATVMREAAVKLAGSKPYIIPLGGSNVIGATGYVTAMIELVEQLSAEGTKVDVIVTASSSGGTQAGLLVGARIAGFAGRILGISVDHPATRLRRMVTALAIATAIHLDLDPVSLAEQVEVDDAYIGPGYGVLTNGEREAIQLMAQFEGLLLDPVYTGRAMYGLIDLIRRGVFVHGQTILFWHTGGTPALFAYAADLTGTGIFSS